MQVKVDGKRNITLDFEAPKKFKLLQDGKEIPYLRTGKNSFRLSRNIDGVLDLEEIIEQPKIVKPMQLQAQQMALVNPNDVLMINQAAQQLEVEQNILGETQKRVEQTQAYLDVQQQRINETVLSVQGLETNNADRITATENGLFNLAGNLAKTEQNLIDGIEIVNNGLQEHKSAENPHRITKKTIGLDKVDNTADMDKPISKAVQNALDEKADKDEIKAIRDELGEYQEKNDRITNALSSYTGGLAYSGSDIIIDDMLSTESENPVQNKVITNALNEKADISDIPTVNNATLTIQKNGTSAGTFSANASEDVNINLIIPTTASDVSALPDSTKYGAGLSLTINSTNYVMTAQLKDQDGNNLGTAQTIDLPLESVVVSGSYDSVNKKIVLTLQNGTTIDIPVGDLISGLQTEITSSNKLNADLVDDSTSTNKFVTASDITTWNGKQDTISDLSTIRTNASNGASAYTTIQGYGDIVTHDASEFATSAQGALADTALQSGDNISELVNDSGYITGITSLDVTTALGYTPYDSANPSGYITSSALAPYVLASSLATVATSGDYDDLINKPTIPTDTSDLTNGAGFITGITSSDVTTALGYTPYNSTNPNGYITSSALSGYATETWVGNQGYITGITSGDVTTALGYTPYDSSNPNGYTSNVGTVTSVNNTSPDGNGNVSLTIPTVNDSTITLTQGGVTKGSFTLNQASGATIDFDAGGGGGSLPPQTGHAGEFLTTDGTDASWAKTPTGRNVGELVYSAMPLTDAGLHLLDGTLLSGGGIYEEFVQYVAGLVSSHPSLFTSESTWQSTVSSKGVCGKFVYTQGKQWYKWYCAQYDYYFYTESLSPQQYDPIYYYNDASNWGVAFYVQYFQEGAEYDTLYGDNGGVSMTRAHGDTTIDLDIPSTIRLPKITGIIEGTTSVSALGDLEAAGLPNITGEFHNWAQNGQGVYATGAFAQGTQRGAGGQAAGGVSYAANFDASRSNSIYGNSTTVQPQTIKQLVYMVIANSTKTEIEVDIDQIATDLNGKADVDLTNLSNTGKIAIAHNSMPSGTYDDLTLGASGTEYTAPADGYYFVNKTSNTSGQFLVIENQTTKMGSELIAVGAYNGLCVWQPVRKGEKVKINYNLGGATSFFRFVYAVGSESEA